MGVFRHIKTHHKGHEELKSGFFTPYLIRGRNEIFFVSFVLFVVKYLRSAPVVNNSAYTSIFLIVLKPSQPRQTPSGCDQGNHGCGNYTDDLQIPECPFIDAVQDPECFLPAGRHGRGGPKRKKLSSGGGKPY